MGLGFYGFGDPAMQRVARTHAQEMAAEYRRHLRDLNEKRTNTLEAAAALDLLGDVEGHIKALSLAVEIDAAIDHAEANLGEWTSS